MADLNKVGVSFKFQKSVQLKKLDQTKISKEAALDLYKHEFVLSVEDKKIKSSVPEIVQKELVIPLIKENNWRLPVNSIKKENVQQLVSVAKSLDEQAANEIIAETRDQIEARESTFKNDSLAIPLILQNKVPEGFETDAKLDVSLRPDPSTLEDYDKIPVSQFGLAMLRGMGWKPGAAIGLKNKQCVELIEVVVRPKGLGLGADKSILEKLKLKDENGEDLVLKIGSYIYIHEGSNKGLYGQVESLDDETGRVYIKLALNGKVIHLPELFLQVVSKKEFQKDGKVINKTKYDKVQDSIDEKNRNKNEDLKRHSKKKKKHRSESHESHRSRSRSPVSHKNGKHKKDKEVSEKSSRDNSHKSWLIAQIRVRFIDQKYKKGKFYKAKVIIEDILNPTSCICKTDNGDILEDIHPKMLETVIPRNDPAYVMVVRGQLRGMVGKILHKDKSSCTATIQLFPDNNVSTLSYDDVSEYVGDVSQYD